MRYLSIYPVGILAAIILLLAINMIFQQPNRLAEANSSHQSTQNLEGKKIYISLTNKELNLFDRGDLGASRVGAMLARDGAELANLTWDVPIPEDADLVILLAPTTDYTSSQMAKLWTYVTQGGNIFIMSDPTAALTSKSALFELLWNTFGIGYQDSVVLDFNSTIPTRPVQLGANNTPMPTATLSSEEKGRHPELITELFPSNNHSILNNIDFRSLSFRGACGLKTESLTVTGSNVIPLLITNENYYGETDLKTFNTSRTSSFSIGLDVTQGRQLLAAISENPDTGSRVGVLCDADLARNDYGFSTSPAGSDRFLYPGNVSLTLNTIYWTLGIENPVIEFKEPAPTATPTIIPTITLTPTITPSPTSIPATVESSG